jgi:hypothetical protein
MISVAEAGLQRWQQVFGKRLATPLPEKRRREPSMSFQAYLDALEDKTGKTPDELLALAAERGYGPATKAGVIVDWLREDFGVGRGHAMAFVHVLKQGPTISDKHVGSTGSHRDESNTLRLDGKAKRTSP